MPEDTDEVSKYHAPLDIDSQRKIEAKNLEDTHTDMYLMSSTDLRKLLTEQPGLFTRDDIEPTYAVLGNMQDSEGKFIKGVTFTTAENPHIVLEQGAAPCSIVFAFDSEGNFGVVHNTQYKEFVDTETQDPKNQDKLEALQQMATQKMKDDYRIVITGTNIDTDTRTQVEKSIIDNLHEIDPRRVDTLYTDGANVRFDTIRPGQVNSTRDNIYGVYFFPKALTPDGKNKVVLVGNSDGSDENVDDMVWLNENFNKLYKPVY